MRRQKFTVEVTPIDALGKAEVVAAAAGKAEVAVSGRDELDLVTLMCAAEYFMYLVARQSDLGYERALEELVRGASEWREEGFT